MLSCSASGRASGAALALLLAAALAWAPPAPAVTSEQDAVRLRVVKYERLLASAPANREYRDELAAALQESQDPAERVRGARLRLELEPGADEVRLDLAQELLRAGQLAEARALFARLLTKGFKPFEALLGLGEVHDLLKAPKVALGYYEQARGLQPKNPAVLEPLGDDYGWVGRYEEAFAAWRAAIANLPRTDPKPRAAIEAKIAKLELERREATRGGDEDEEDLEVGARIRNVLAALAAEPQRPELRIKLGELYLEAERPEQAVPEFQRVVSVEGVRYAAVLGLGRAFDAAGDERLACSWLERAAALQPDRPEAWLELGQVTTGLGDLTRATSFVEKARARRPAERPLALVEGRLLLARGAVSEAEARYRRLLAKAPDDADAAAGLALCAVHRKDFGAALGLLEPLLKASPRSYGLLEVQVEAARGRGDRTLEARALNLLSARRPADLALAQAAAAAAADAGDRRAAYDHHARTLRLAPTAREVVVAFRSFLEQEPASVGHRELRLLLREREARALAAENLPEEAVALLDRLVVDVAAMGRDAQAEGRAARAAGREALARGHLERALAAAEAEIRCRRTLAELCLDLERPKAVEAQYRALLALDPRQAPYVLALAELYHEQGRHGSAKRYYQALPPERLEPDARLRRAETFAKAGSRTDAVRQVKRLEREAPPDDVVAMRLGEWQLERGNVWRAKRYFCEALGLASANADAHELLRKIYLERTPDAELLVTHMSDSDGQVLEERMLEYRARVRGWRVGARLGHGSLEDLYARTSGPDLTLSVGRDLGTKADWVVALGVDPKSQEAGSYWNAQATWHLADKLDLGLELGRDGVGETALAASRGLMQDTQRFWVEVFCSPRVSLRGEVERAALTDGNARDRARAEATAGLPWFLPGSVRAAAWQLDYDFPVAPVLYYAPGGASGRELAYELALPLHKTFAVESSFTFGHETTREDYRTLSLAGRLEAARNRLLSVEYVRTDADRSVHGGASPYRSTTFTAGLGVLF